MEKRREIQAKYDVDEQKLSAAAQRRAEAVQKAEERRRVVEESQLRVMQAEAEAAKRFGTPGQYADPDVTFGKVKASWSEQQRWAAEREQRIAAVMRQEAQWMRRYDAKRRLQASSIAPGTPGLCSSAVFEELATSGRPMSEATGAPTALTQKQLRLEGEFRKRQLALRAEEDGTNQLLQARLRS